ncbi:MAG TPA: dTDP-glucose 4,6-dehydratase [bacterium]|nr:dTDP-glucose 4,6-dehydratase [bacterium]
MKLLVTGGAGFIGSNFIHYWVRHHPDDHIVNLDKLTYAGNLENLELVERHPRYRFVQGDVCDGAMVDSLMHDADVVVHFAAESHVDRSILNPAPFIQTNITGTAILLEAALRNKIKRFHHISTDEVFGALPLGTQERFTDRSRYDPRNPYAASKAAADHLVRACAVTYGLPITISNCSNNFGPYQFPEKLIPLTITNALEEKKIPLYGDGLHVRDWLYVEDHCRAIDLILRDGVVGQTYLIGGLTEDVSNLEIVKKILVVMGKDEGAIQYVEDRPGHDRRYAIDWSATRDQLGWTPRYDLNEALAKTIDWFRQNEPWWNRVKSGEYQDYYTKQYRPRRPT